MMHNFEESETTSETTKVKQLSIRAYIRLGRQFERELTETKKQHDKNNSSLPSLRIDTSPFLLAQNGHDAQLLLTWQETISSFRVHYRRSNMRESTQNEESSFLTSQPSPTPNQKRTQTCVISLSRCGRNSQKVSCSCFHGITKRLRVWIIWWPLSATGNLIMESGKFGWSTTVQFSRKYPEAQTRQ